MQQAPLTAKQVRAGRALLAWSQQDLAKKAGVAASTVADFERGQRTPVPNNADAMRAALEQAGIHFPKGGAVIGPELPALGQRTKSGAPIRWVDATDLAQWGERRAGQGALPGLIARLARAAGPVMVHFPSDEGVQYAGWDGITDASVASEYVPLGKTGWEIGTQRDGIAGKATEDYDKRTKAPSPLEPPNDTFVFVTPRHWPDKDKWVAEKMAQGDWRDVRAYDGADLVHWLETYPAVGQWMATHLGKRPPGTHQLEELWLEWSLATLPPLPPDLVLSDRDRDAANLLNWLRQTPCTLALQGETAEEVAAFAYAAISQLPLEVAEHYLARSLVAATPDTARILSDSSSPLILILIDPEPGLAERIAQKGHHVLMAYGANSGHGGRLHRLERPSRDGIEAALKQSGLDEDRAKRSAREAYRSLAILRRLMPAQTSRTPMWAQSRPPKALLAALLVGAWDESSEADKAIVARLADMPYDDAIADIAPYAGHLDSPLRKVGQTWKIASPQDAWLLLAPYLTAAQIDRFEKSILDVLGAADPRYKMDPNERWYASIHNKKPEYSAYLRHGLGEILIMLALFGGHARTVSEAQTKPDRIVRTLLQGADAQRWWSLSRDFQLLAEAAPDAFLDAVDDSLDQDSPPIESLFGRDETPFFNTEHLSDLLWALESLAWSPHYLRRVSTILARLDIIDPPGGNSGNRPASSLRHIFLLWLPQTNATLAERLRVLDVLRKELPDSSWKLMLGILPSGHDSLTPASTTRWRDFSLDGKEKEEVTWGLVNDGATALTERLCADVGKSAQRWATLLERLHSFPDRVRIIQQLAAAADGITDLAERQLLWDKLRGILHHNREFKDSDWALPEIELSQLESIYNRLTPTDMMARYAWLFAYGAALPNPDGQSWEDEGRQISQVRQSAANALFAEKGADIVFQIAEVVEDGGNLGAALINGGLAEHHRDALLDRALSSANTKHHLLAHGMIVASFWKNGQDRGFAKRLLARACTNNWSDLAVQTILFALPSEAWVWDMAKESGEQVELEYWKRMPILKTKAEDAEVPFVTNHLISVGRARDAVHFLGFQIREHEVSPDLLVHTLLEAVRQPFGRSEDRNESTMFQYYVSQILAKLDKCPEVTKESMLQIEWAYLPLLEHSKRPARVIMEELARNPSLFVDLVCTIFKPAEDSGVVDPPIDDLDRAQQMATQAFNLLQQWSVVPGTHDGAIDADALEDWVTTARKIAKEKGRLDVADQKIGEILSASPIGADGLWPDIAVRELLQNGVRSKHIETGFEIGKCNRRGVTTRLPRDGGALERNEAANYRNMAQKMTVEWPRMARLLEELAKHYEIQAGWHDNDAERLDW